MNVWNWGRVHIHVDQAMATMIPNDVEESVTKGKIVFFNFMPGGQVSAALLYGCQ